MIKPKCIRCKDELRELGAVVISPPHHDAITTPLVAIVSKYHVCVLCYPLLVDWMSGAGNDEPADQLKLKM